MSWNLNTWDAFWTNQVQMRQIVEGRWRVEEGLQVLLGVWLMQLECAKVLHKSLLVPIFTYCSETMI